MQKAREHSLLKDEPTIRKTYLLLWFGFFSLFRYSKKEKFVRTFVKKKCIKMIQVRDNFTSLSSFLNVQFLLMLCSDKSNEDDIWKNNTLNKFLYMRLNL